MAELFATHGCHVFVVDVIPDRVNQTVEKIGRKNATGLVMDLSAKDQVEKMIDEAYDSKGRIDILCNNAGIMDGVTPVAEISDELWQRVLNINLDAPVLGEQKSDLEDAQ